MSSSENNRQIDQEFILIQTVGPFIERRCVGPFGSPLVSGTDGGGRNVKKKR